MAYLIAGSASRFHKHDVVVIKTAGGQMVPTSPWPQKFIVSRVMLATDQVELRPLTLTGFLKGVVQNFMTMNWWRFCYVLRGLGLLNTPEAGRYSWRQVTLRVWRYQEIRRFRWVRFVQAKAAQIKREDTTPRKGLGD